MTAQLGENGSSMKKSYYNKGLMISRMLRLTLIISYHIEKTAIGEAVPMENSIHDRIEELKKSIMLQI